MEYKKSYWGFDAPSKEERCTDYLNKFIDELKNKNSEGMKRVLSEMVEENCLWDYQAEKLSKRIDNGEHITKPLMLEYDLIETIVENMRERYLIFPEELD